MKLRSPYDKDIFQLAIPALGTLIAEPLYVLADTAIVGRIGTNELAGLALASTVLLTAHSLCVFLAYSTTAIVARALGANNRPDAAHYGVQTLWLATILGIVFALGIAASSRQLLQLLGASGAVEELGLRYLRISLVGFPFLLLSLAAGGFFNGRKNTRTPLRIALIAAVTNLVIELLLVVGLGYGIGASALSTVIAQTGAAIAAVTLNLRWALPLVDSFRPTWNSIVDLMAKGWALVLRTAALRGALTLSTALATRLGVTEVAGHQIGLQIWFTYALVLDAVAIAGQALTGTFLGAQATKEARSVANRMIQLDLVVGVVGMIGIFLLRHQLAQLFTNSPDVIQQTSLVLAFVALSQPINSYVFALDGVLIGAGDNNYLGATMVISMLVFVAASVFAGQADLGLTGVWIALTAMMFSRAFWLWFRFRTNQWMRV